MLRGLLNSAIRSQVSGRRGAGTGGAGYSTGRRSRGYGRSGGGGDIGGQVGAQVGRSLFGLMRRR